MQKMMLLIYKKIIRIIYGHNFGKIYPFKIIKHFIISLLRSNFAEIQGHKMFLDSKDSLGLSINKIYEPFETDFVQKEIKRGDVVLDIGANIGYYTLILAKCVGKEGKVFAFEPEPNNFSLLKKNIQINGYKNVVLVQKAVSNKNEKLMMYLNKDNTGCHTIYNLHNSCQSIEIESIRLDDYFENYNEKIDFIKMDVEGAEGGAIQGMYNLLKKNNLKIITEFNPIPLKEFGINSEEYLKLLNELGFNLYEISEQEKQIKPVNIPKLLKKYPPDKKKFTNLLCIKENIPLENSTKSL